MTPSLNVERDPGRARRVIVKFFLIPIYVGAFFYLAGAAINADFNIAAWFEIWRLIGAIAWLFISALLINQA